MQAKTQIITNNDFVNTINPPNIVLTHLLNSLSNPCNCGQTTSNNDNLQSNYNQQIKALQSEISNIRSEVVQVQNLLQVRDNLYKQLDLLREQRDQIEIQIENSTVNSQLQTGKFSGYREMNERLKRRIYQVRQYIQKMNFENQKIEQGLISNQYQDAQFFSRRKQVQQQPVYQGKRYNNSNFESMISKMHQKQQQAWKRVRRQEDDIQRRNIQARNRKSNAFTYYSPKSRTYYSPNRQIY